MYLIHNKLGLINSFLLRRYSLRPLSKEVPRDFIGVKHECVAQGGADGLGGESSVECPQTTLILVDLFCTVDHPAIRDESAVIGILGVPLNLKSCFYRVLKGLERCWDLPRGRLLSSSRGLRDHLR
jgi:hypothetical protein